MTDFFKIENIKNNKALTIFSAFFVLAFISLGFWQIERAADKSNLIKNFKIQQSSQPQYISDTSTKWSRVIIEGSYDSSKQVLIDNQILNGRVGYKIYTPFYFGKDQQIFVDRGWVSQGKSRSEFPKINFNSDIVRIVGTLYKPEKEVLAGDELLTNNWPMVSQTKSPKVIETAYEKKFFDMVLMLEPGSKFIAEFVPFNPFVITPTKHYGYALQWFTMSIVLAGMYVFAITRTS
jgi:surfeit locus 1 family protein